MRTAAAVCGGAVSRAYPFILLQLVRNTRITRFAAVLLDMRATPTTLAAAVVSVRFVIQSEADVERLNLYRFVIVSIHLALHH